VAPPADGGRGPVDVNYHLTVTNNGYATDSYTMSSSGSLAGFTVSFLDSTCTSSLTTTSLVAAGDSADVCVRVHIDAGTGTTNLATVKATSVGNAAVSATAQVKTIAIGVDTLLVDNDDNKPDVQQIYKDALTAAGIPFTTWDLRADGAVSQTFLLGFKNVVWFTGNSYPEPIVPYEPKLKAFLDAGNRLFVSGQDLLDQDGGTTAFARDYLHINWDGSEAQNDKATTKVHSVNTAGTLSNGIGDVAINHSVLGAAFEDQVTPIAPATAIFTDDAGQPDALQFAGTYKVVFLGFPLEAYGDAGAKSALMTRVLNFFNS
jgi:hypothetical protein